jgi:hypothetical protein
LGADRFAWAASRSAHAQSLKMGATPEIDRYAIAAELFPNQPEGFPLDSDFDLSTIALPKDDDFGIPSDDEGADDLDNQTESGFGSVIGTLLQRAGGGRAPERAAPRSMAFSCPPGDSAPPLCMHAVVGNIPVVPPEKYEKLAGVIRKIYSQIGNIREGALLDGSSKGLLAWASCSLGYHPPVAQVASTCPWTRRRS